MRNLIKSFLKIKKDNVSFLAEVKCDLVQSSMTVSNCPVQDLAIYRVPRTKAILVLTKQVIFKVNPLFDL